MSAMPAEFMPPEIEPEPIAAVPHQPGSTPPRQAPPPHQAVGGPLPRQAASSPRRSGPRPSGPRSRPATQRPRTGVHACSAALRAVPPVAAPPAPEVMAARVTSVSHPRLTARGRSVAVACAVVVATLLWFAVASVVQASGHAVPPPPTGHGATTQVVVQPGQTLWSLAAQADPTADTRLVVQRIVTLNNLTGENIAAGQHLLIPQG